MASTSCFLHHHAISSSATGRNPAQRYTVSVKPTQLVCKAQLQDGEPVSISVSRRLALTVLIGADAA